MHITITGRLGSGKSTVCRILAKRYGYEVFSTGDILRRIAQERNQDLCALNRELNVDPGRGIDHMIDSATARISRERPDDRIIFDSRMAWHFAENTFKVFLTVDPMVAARRVFLDPRGRGAEESYGTIAEACETLLNRSRLERERFIDFYGMDYCDYGNFNLIVDTSARTPDETADIVWDGFEAYLSDPEGNVHREFL